MTLDLVATISCDFCPTEIEVVGFHRARNAHLVAAGDGWRRDAKSPLRDVCPACAERFARIDDGRLL